MNKYSIIFIFIFTVIQQPVGYCQAETFDSSAGRTSATAVKSATPHHKKNTDLTNAADTASLRRITAALKNPFIPQLPKPEPEPVVFTDQVFEPEPEPTPTPIPEPITSDRPQHVPKPHFTINGLVWDTDHPQAIVNNNIIDKGEFVGQWKVINIEKQGITVQYRNYEYLIEPQQ